MHYIYRKPKTVPQNSWRNAKDDGKTAPVTMAKVTTTAGSKWRKKGNFIISFIAAYFEDSNIHGLQYVVKGSLTTIESCLWLTLLIVSMYFCVEIGLQSVDRYYTKSTVVGLERDYYYWNTTLPSVTICPLIRLDEQLFNKYCRCLWLTLLIVSMYFCVEIGLQSVDRYYTKSTVVGLERDYYYWNTTLPSVTICPLIRLDEQLFNKYCREHNLSAEQQQEFFVFVEKLANSTYSNFLDIPNNKSIDLILDRLNIKPNKYMELIHNVTKDASFRYKSDVTDQGDTIRSSTGDLVIETRQVLTEYGLCYMTNTMLSEKYSSSYLIWKEYPVNEIKGLPSIVQVKKCSYFDNDVSYNFLGFNHSPMDAFLHSSYEVMRLDHNLGYANESLQVDVDCIEIIAEDGLENGASVEQRKCRFQHESNLTHFPVYTRTICHQECRLNLVYKMCKCIPHFYPNHIKNPKIVCDYKTLRECLVEHEQLFIKLYSVDSNGDKQMVPCYCAQNCQDAIVNKRSKVQLQKANALMGGNSIMFAIINLPTYRLKRLIIFSFTDLLVSIGGNAGLFLGFSVLCLVEVIYYFTLRLFFYLIKMCCHKN